jgi:hypothetical protein
MSKNISFNKTKKLNKSKLAKNLGICRQGLYYQPKLPAKDLVLKARIEETPDFSPKPTPKKPRSSNPLTPILKNPKVDL